MCAQYTYLLIMDVLCMHIHTGTYSLARDGGQRNGPQIHSTEHQRQLLLDVCLIELSTSPSLISHSACSTLEPVSNTTHLEWGMSCAHA